MSENSFDKFKYVLKEDLKSYLNGLNDLDFGFCNILSNRIMTNSLILNSKINALLGAVLKEITYEFRFYKEDVNLKRGLRKLKKILNNYISDKYDLDAKMIMEDYQDYYNEFRDLIKVEREIYKDNPEFSQFSINFCLEFYIKELNFNDTPVNLDVLVFGVLNELNRVIKSHGSTSKQLMLKIILNSFGRMHEYFRIYLQYEEEKIKRWKESYDKFKKNLLDNLERFNDDKDYIENSIDFLFEICKEWRYMFIRMLEIPKISTSVVEKQTTVPKKVKEDLDEIVSELIDSKLEDKKE
ncbi:MAG: hypothetical protein EU529_05110 [Promethearchaeota archaeon]|nr:MAG: hypothetical protein EU529_05110 [Candidatus Lokiarchaeota archaeon]